MIKNKIDLLLLTKAKALSEDKKITCIIKASNYNSLKNLLVTRKIKIINEYLFIKSFLVQLSKEELEYFSRLVSVEYIYSVATACALMNVSKKILGINESSLSGRGIVTAIIDTGVSPHLDFCLGKKRLKKSIDFVNQRKSFYDDNGHGTFVCGVMAGCGAESGGKLAGVAPSAEIISLKALDKNGEAYSNKILDAMEWVFDNHKKEGIKVVCMSFGSEPLGFNDPIKSGAEALWQEGIIVVSAAGNSGPEYQTIKSPGVSSKIITVGGLDDNRFDNDEFHKELFEIADFSSRGPSFNRYKPDVIAPAVEISSCDRLGGYTKLSGTSVATPMIAGLMCLMCEKYPNLTPDKAKQLLIKNCNPIIFNKNIEGWGLPNFTNF